MVEKEVLSSAAADSSAMAISRLQRISSVTGSKFDGAATEATSRRLNMVRAAADLGLTQGAISRQIKALEGRLGEPLFRRGPRGLTLTEAGDLLSDYVARGLGELATGL